MEPREALDIIEQATGILTLTRAQHIQVQTALEVLRHEIEKKSGKKK